MIKSELIEKMAERYPHLFLRDIEKIKRDAETANTLERMENTVMRERISDLAAEIARITSVLEGPGSPIDAILAKDASRPRGLNGNGHGPKDGLKDGTTGEARPSLADRIRALQSRGTSCTQPTAPV